MGARETGGPLAALCDRLLRVRPVKLSVVVTLMDEVEDYQAFKRLVKEFLPEAEQEILKPQVPCDMIAAFARAFGQRYFPLSDSLIDQAESFSDLVSYIPVPVYGWEDDDYHFLTDNRPGVILSSLLVDFEGEMGLTGEGIRVTVLEAAEKIVSRGLLARVPPRGYPLESLRAALAHRYQGLCYFAEALCHASDNEMLNVTNEGFWAGPPDWSREMVEHLTEQWHDLEKKNRAMASFWSWLENKPEARFRTVLDFLESEV